MKKLETLLNQLIKLGWEPFGEENVKIEKTRNGFRFRSPLIWGFTSYSNRSLREIVSLESGLWQFCAENELLNIDKRITVVYRKGYFISDTDETIASDRYYQYRLLESALVPEDKLGQFLLDNITINESANESA